jgi:hypothetical protein
MFTFPLTLHSSSGFSNEYSSNFNGVDEYITLGNAFSYTNNLSVFCWVSTNNLTSNKTIFSKEHTGINQRSWVMRVTSGGLLRVGISADGGATNRKDYTATSGNIENNGWHLVGFTFVTNVLKLYVDGVEVATSKGSDPTVNAIHTGTTDIEIGRQRNGLEEYPGKIDEPTVWTGTVLSASDITTLYNSGIPVDPSKLTLSGTLAHHWRMGDGDNSTTTFDKVGSADGTLVNMDASNYVLDTP